MAKSAATKAAMLNAQTAISGFVAYHTADPGNTGANEGAAGRVAVTWANATDSPVSGGTVNVPVTPGVTYTHFGLWSAGTGGVFRDGAALSASFTPAAGVTSVPLTLAATQA